MASARGTSREVDALLQRLQQRISALESKVGSLSSGSASSTTTSNSTTSSDSLSLAILAPADLASTATVGVSKRAAKEDHAHRVSDADEVPFDDDGLSYALGDDVQTAMGALDAQAVVQAAALIAHEDNDGDPHAAARYIKVPEGAAAGDLLFFDGTSVALLGIGSEGQVATVTSGLPGWADASGSSITLSGRVAAYGDLPSTLGSEDAGAAYLVEADGLIYVWDGAAWPADGSGLNVSGSGGGSTVVVDDAASTISFTGLDLVSDFCYVVRGQAMVSASGSSALRIWVNGDETSTNYKRLRHNNGGTYSDSYFVDGSTIAANSIITFTIQINQLSGGFPVFKTTVCVTNGSALLYIYEGADVIRLNTENLKSFSLVATSTISAFRCILEKPSSGLF